MGGGGERGIQKSRRDETFWTVKTAFDGKEEGLISGGGGGFFEVTALIFAAEQLDDIKPLKEDFCSDKGWKRSFSPPPQVRVMVRRRPGLLLLLLTRLQGQRWWRSTSTPS